MKWIAAAFLIFTPALGLAGQLEKPITIAVIDSGFGYRGAGHDAKLCKYGHKDFTKDNEYDMTYGTKDAIPLDKYGHGTNVAGLIQAYAGTANYCLVILKYVNTPRQDKNLDQNLLKAIQYADEIKVDLINFSGVGSELIPDEIKTVKKFLDSGGIFVASAGNDRDIINGPTHYKAYPAMDDDRIVVVGSKNPYPIDNLFSDNGELAENGWNVSERMPEINEKLDKQGFCILVIDRKDTDVIYEDENEKPIPHTTEYYRVLIKKGNDIFLKSDFSNFGKRVNRWEPGDVQTAYGITFSGTSQATAIATGKIVDDLSQKLSKWVQQ